MLMALTRNQVSNRVNQHNAPRIATFSLQVLSPWACSLLDLSNSELSKQYVEEGKGLSQKFDLDPTKFETFKKYIMEKGEHCCMKSILTFDQNNIKLNLVTMFARITKTMVTNAVTKRWITALPKNVSGTDQNTLQDKRIKANLLGTFLLQSLLDSAKCQHLKTKSVWKKKIQRDDCQRCPRSLLVHHKDCSSRQWSLGQYTEDMHLGTVS